MLAEHVSKSYLRHLTGTNQEPSKSTYHQNCIRMENLWPTPQHDVKGHSPRNVPAGDEWYWSMLEPYLSRPQGKKENKCNRECTKWLMSLVWWKISGFQFLKVCIFKLYHGPKRSSRVTPCILAIVCNGPLQSTYIILGLEMDENALSIVLLSLFRNQTALKRPCSESCSHNSWITPLAFFLGFQ